jgi:hypothetical protein
MGTFMPAIYYTAGFPSMHRSGSSLCLQARKPLSYMSFISVILSILIKQAELVVNTTLIYFNQKCDNLSVEIIIPLKN